ncbi:MAG: hypothetical protein OEV44_13030 [Spirochaetota bacterium]|nr:hypothetical protein [Spirochaetota bacterium]
MRRRFVFFLIFQLFVLAIELNAWNLKEKKLNYISSNYFAISVFRNIKGIIEWKNDFLELYKKQYNKIIFRNFDDSILKLKGKIDYLIKSYKRDPEKSKYFNSIIIPVIRIKGEEQSNFQIYCNGVLLIPSYSENVGEINVYLSENKTSSNNIKTFQSYTLILYTFSDYISNQKVVLSTKNERDIAHTFNIGQGILIKDLFQNND